MEHNIVKVIENITEDWITTKMQDLGLKRKHLIEEIGFTKSYLSLLLASEDKPHKIHLTKQTKALFYYYFKTKELGATK